MKVFLLSILFFYSLLGRDVINGTTALFEFSQLSPETTIEYESKNIPLLSHPVNTHKKFVLVPINYRESIGDKKLILKDAKSTKTLLLHVKQGEYPFENITVTPSKVKPNKKQRKRTSREYKEAMKIYNTTRPKRYWNKPFINPLDSKITSNFGSARMFNNTLKSFHSGTDFRAKIGTPIIASNDGVVVIAKDRYYAGNSVVIDHGEGIYSCYYHLSLLHVKVGDTIKQAQTVGLSGATGRVSGPHLHYAIMLQGVQVNPLQFHELINSLFESAKNGANRTPIAFSFGHQ
ncbi:MAG: M23 family metallopeptidase [Campylobacterota bacterium]|nr:M23 family metallopeptidase [Campylobacterota bacterium]